MAGAAYLDHRNQNLPKKLLKQTKKDFSFAAFYFITIVGQ
jgi:hypothetical protein